MDLLDHKKQALIRNPLFHNIIHVIQDPIPQAANSSLIKAFLSAPFLFNVHGVLFGGKKSAISELSGISLPFFRFLTLWEANFSFDQLKKTSSQ